MCAIKNLHKYFNPVSGLFPLRNLRNPVRLQIFLKRNSVPLPADNYYENYYNRYDRKRGKNAHGVKD